MAIMVKLTFYLYGLINGLPRPNENIAQKNKDVSYFWLICFSSYSFSAHKKAVNHYYSFKVQVQCSMLRVIAWLGWKCTFSYPLINRTPR